MLIPCFVCVTCTWEAPRLRKHENVTADSTKAFGFVFFNKLGHDTLKLCAIQYKVTYQTNNTTIFSLLFFFFFFPHSAFHASGHNSGYVLTK